MGVAVGGVGDGGGEVVSITWWRHQMETFSALLAICAENSPVPGEFPAQRPVTRSFDVFFDLRLNNGWVNNREAGDLRRYLAHYDVSVMKEIDISQPSCILTLGENYTISTIFFRFIIFKIICQVYLKENIENRWYFKADLWKFLFFCFSPLTMPDILKMTQPVVLKTVWFGSILCCILINMKSCLIRTKLLVTILDFEPMTDE